MNLDHLSLVSSSVLSHMLLYHFYKTKQGQVSSFSPLYFQQQLLCLNSTPIFSLTMKHPTSFWLIGALAAGDHVWRQQNSLPVQHL